MIERKFVNEKIKEFQIQEYVGKIVKGAGHDHTEVKRTPLGDKIIIYAARPGMVVGRKGAHIKDIGDALKKEFELENPQVEIAELASPNVSAKVVAEKVSAALEKFGAGRFKRVGYSTMDAVMKAGALGVEILISGKIPGARAKTWRFYQGYLKKSGSVAQYLVDKAISTAELKTGTIGIQVSIMPPDIKLPDAISVKGEEASITEKRIQAAKAAGASLPKLEGEEGFEKGEEIKEVIE